jgi:hypothetical protein
VEYPFIISLGDSIYEYWPGVHLITISHWLKAVIKWCRFFKEKSNRGSDTTITCILNITVRHGMEPKRMHGYRTHSLINTLRMECGVNTVFGKEDKSCFSCSRETDEGVLRRTCGVWSRDNASELEYRSSLLPTRLHLAWQSIGTQQRSNAFLYAIHFKHQCMLFLYWPSATFKSHRTSTASSLRH